MPSIPIEHPLADIPIGECSSNDLFFFENGRRHISVPSESPSLMILCAGFSLRFDPAYRDDGWE
jgi:hypothetical protein